jgi:hypothetical protein
VWDAVAARTAEGSTRVRIALVCRMLASPCMFGQTNKASSSTALFSCLFHRQIHDGTHPGKRIGKSRTFHGELRIHNNDPFDR